MTKMPRARISAAGVRRKQLLAVALMLAVPGCGKAQSSGDVSSLVLERTIPLAGVSGRIDHLAADVGHERVFVAELGNGSVDVVDLKSGQSRRISDFKSPQGLGYIEGRKELVVASGGDGSVRFLYGASLAQTATLHPGSDADDVRVDAATGHVVVGYGSGALAVIDPVRRAVVRIITLPAHPEGFSIAPSTHRAYVNVPDDRSIVAVDLDTGTQLARWHAAHLMNFPMALDAGSKMLAIVYRLPARLALIDAGTGTVKQDLPTCGDADDVYFDARRSRIYVSCGSGLVDVFQRGGGAYIHIASIVTELDRLFVAARAQDGKAGASLLVYRPGP